jgi:hypothetical protein
MAVAGTTTSTSYTESVYTTILSSDILTELRPASVMRQFFKAGQPGSSKSFDFLLIDPNTSNSPALLYTNTETGVGEDGTPYTVRELQTDKARATAGPVGIMGAVADVTKAVSNQPVREELSAALGRTLKHKWEVDATANFSSVTASTTAASSMSSSALASVSSPAGVSRPPQRGQAAAGSDTAVTPTTTYTNGHSNRRHSASFSSRPRLANNP